jgi:hypothetical protein
MIKIQRLVAVEVCTSWLGEHFCNLVPPFDWLVLIPNLIRFLFLLLHRVLRYIVHDTSTLVIYDLPSALLRLTTFIWEYWEQGHLVPSITSLISHGLFHFHDFIPSLLPDNVIRRMVASVIKVFHVVRINNYRSLTPKTSDNYMSSTQSECKKVIPPRE